MKIIPFGEIIKDRFEIAKRYKLIEPINDIWRLTKKCKDNYISVSFHRYLRGNLEQPKKITKQTKKELIGELLEL